MQHLDLAHIAPLASSDGSTLLLLSAPDPATNTTHLLPTRSPTTPSKRWPTTPSTTTSSTSTLAEPAPSTTGQLQPSTPQTHRLQEQHRYDQNSHPAIFRYPHRHASLLAGKLYIASSYGLAFATINPDGSLSWEGRSTALGFGITRLFNNRSHQPALVFTDPAAWNQYDDKITAVAVDVNVSGFFRQVFYHRQNVFVFSVHQRSASNHLEPGALTGIDLGWFNPQP